MAANNERVLIAIESPEGESVRVPVVELSLASLRVPFPGTVGLKYSDDGETIPCVVPLKEGKFCTPERGWSVPGRTYITMQGRSTTFPAFKSKKTPKHVGNTRKRKATITIGVGKFINGEFKKCRRSQLTDLGGFLKVGPLSVDCSKEDVLKEAVIRWNEAGFYTDTIYTNFHLVYPGGKVIETLPDGKTDFTLERYRIYQRQSYYELRMFLVHKDDFDVLEVEDTDVPKSSAVLVSAKKEPTATAATSTTHTSYIDESYHRIENSTHDKTDTPTVSFKKDPQDKKSDFQHEDLYQRYAVIIGSSSDESDADSLPSLPSLGLNSCDALVETGKEEQAAVIEGPALDTLVNQFRSEAASDSVVTIVIQRRRLLKTTRRATGQIGFDFRALPKVMFSGEMGMDGGGPSREFFRLLMAGILNELGVFEGSGPYVLSHSLTHLSEKTYLLAGQYVVWSIMHGGPGLPVFPKVVFDLMMGEEVSISIQDIELIPDHVSKENIRKIARCSTETDLREVTQELGDWMIDSGITKLTKMTDIKEVVDCLTKYFLYQRCLAEYCQFKEGLSLLGLWELVKEHKRTMNELLCFSERRLTAAEMKSLYEVSWSDSHRKKTQEEDTVFLWEDFLVSCEKGQHPISLEDILIFWTGADKVPALGFPTKLTLSFYEMGKDGRLPTASTCSTNLMLPYDIESQEDRFTRMMVRAIQESQGFGII